MRTLRHSRHAALATLVVAALFAVAAEVEAEAGPPVPAVMAVDLVAQDLAPPGLGADLQVATAETAEVVPHGVPIHQEVAATAAWGNTEEPAVDTFQYLERLIVIRTNTGHRWRPLLE